MGVTGYLHTSLIRTKAVSSKFTGYRTDLLEEKRTQSQPQSWIPNAPSAVLNDWHNHML